MTVVSPPPTDGDACSMFVVPLWMERVIYALLAAALVTFFVLSSGAGAARTESSMTLVPVLDNDSTMKMLLPDGTFLMLVVTDFSKAGVSSPAWRVSLTTDGSPAEASFSFPKGRPKASPGGSR